MEGEEGRKIMVLGIIKGCWNDQGTKKTKGDAEKDSFKAKDQGTIPKDNTKA